MTSVGCPYLADYLARINKPMTRKQILFALLPHAAALAIFITLSSVYFSPVWKGYELRQGDIDNWRGMSKEVMDYRMLNGQEPLWTNSMFGGMPAYQISTEHKSNLMRPVLVALRLGLPGPVGVLFLAMLGFYIFALCLRINPWLGIAGAVAFGFSTINILYLGAGHAAKVNAIALMPPVLGGLILAFRGKALAGSAIFMLFLALHITANHLQMTYYLAILCGLAALSESIRLVVEKRHLEWIKGAAALAVAAGIAVLPAMSNLLTTAEYSKYTTRGQSELTTLAEDDNVSTSGLATDYILDYNFGPGEQWSLFIPNAKGGQSAPIANNKDLLKKIPRDFRDDLGRQNQYWGEQRFTGGAFYFSAIMMCLFVLGLILVNDWLRWPFLIMTILALGLSAKNYTGLNAFFIESFPLYNKFRDSKMMLVTIQVMAPAMAVLLIQQIIREQLWTKNRRIVLAASGGLLLIALIVSVKPDITGPLLSAEETAMFDNYSSQAKGDGQQLSIIEEYKESLITVRAQIFKSDALRSILFAVFGLAIALLAFFRLIKEPVAGLALAALVAIDLWGVDQRYLNDSKVKSEYNAYVKSDDKIVPYKPSTADFAILELEGGTAEYESTRIQLLDAIGRTNPFRRLKDNVLAAHIAEFGALNLTTNYRVLNLGNTFNDAATSYFHKSIGGYHGAKLRSYQELIDYQLGSDIKMVIDSMRIGDPLASLESANALNMLNAKYVIYHPGAPPIENPNALGNAWFVDEVIPVNSADEEIQSISEINPRHQAVALAEASAELNPASQPDPMGVVVLEEYSPGHQRYKSTSDTGGPIVFSEIYYPAGWVCRVDGKEVPYYRVNYVLRAVAVESGEHSIEWSFEPSSWQTGNRYSLAGSIVLLLLVAVTGFREMKAVVANRSPVDI